MATKSATVPVGQPAPDFTLGDSSGTEVSLSGLRGSPVVLVFLRGFG
jgi:peroxiredoxin